MKELYKFYFWNNISESVKSTLKFSEIFLILVYHVITEWLTLEGTSGGHVLQLSAQAGLVMPFCSGPCPGVFLKISRRRLDGLGSLQYIPVYTGWPRGEPSTPCCSLTSVNPSMYYGQGNCVWRWISTSIHWKRWLESWNIEKFVPDESPEYLRGNRKNTVRKFAGPFEPIWDWMWQFLGSHC